MEQLITYTYFYVLAAIGMIFVGFMSVAAVLRQAIGRAPSAYHIALMGDYVLRGMLVVLFALAWPAFLLAGIGQALSVPLLSIAMALAVMAISATGLMRAFRFDAGLKPHHWLIYLVRAILLFMLVANAAGERLTAALSPIVAAATWELVALLLDFAFGLDLILDTTRKTDAP